jgi:heptosyltransferase I
VSKICIARIDRIGDLVLTLPCQAEWLSVNPEDEIQWLVPEGLRFVIENARPRLNPFYVSSPKTFREKLKAMTGLKSVLAGKKFDQVVAVHVPWWAALAFFLARIPIRTGPGSQWFSWIFYNRRLRQKRSQSAMHEADYNLELIRFALGKPRSNSTCAPARLTAPENLKKRWAEILSAQGVLPGRFAVIHPGMGGSARNWPPSFYKDLGQKLKDAGVAVVLTGGSGDLRFISETGLDSIPGIVSLVGKTGGEDILAVLSMAGCVVAPSTGVAHLAASLGIPVAGLYSPVRVQAPLRWAPRGDRVKVFVPSVDCPGTRSCLGPECRAYDCMEQIDVESVRAYVMDNL